jgi:hypothetical protein
MQPKTQFLGGLKFMMLRLAAYYKAPQVAGTAGDTPQIQIDTRYGPAASV